MYIVYNPISVHQPPNVIETTENIYIYAGLSFCAISSVCEWSASRTPMLTRRRFATKYVYISIIIRLIYPPLLLLPILASMLGDIKWCAAWFFFRDREREREAKKPENDHIEFLRMLAYHKICILCTLLNACVSDALFIGQSAYTLDESPIPEQCETERSQLSQSNLFQMAWSSPEMEKSTSILVGYSNIVSNRIWFFNCIVFLCPSEILQ